MGCFREHSSIDWARQYVPKIPSITSCIRSPQMYLAPGQITDMGERCWKWLCSEMKINIRTIYFAPKLQLATFQWISFIVKYVLSTFLALNVFCLQDHSAVRWRYLFIYLFPDWKKLRPKSLMLVDLLNLFLTFMLVSERYCNKHQTQWLKTTEMYYLRVSEDGHLKSRCWQNHGSFGTRKEESFLPYSYLLVFCQ